MRLTFTINIWKMNKKFVGKIYKFTFIWNHEQMVYIVEHIFVVLSKYNSRWNFSNKSLLFLQGLSITFEISSFFSFKLFESWWEIVLGKSVAKALSRFQRICKKKSFRNLIKHDLIKFNTNLVWKYFMVFTTTP